MTGIFAGGFIAALFLLVFLVLLLIGIRRRRMGFIYAALIAVLLALGTGVWTAIAFMGKAYRTARAQRLENPFRARTGMEIYTALFGAPQADCVQVLHQKDQLVPRLDCCIWLEFRTCPSELKRILAQEAYTGSYVAVADTSRYLSGYTERPEWFRPQQFADSLLQLEHIDERSRLRTFLVSKDSTHVFYCDRAD